MAHPMRYRFPFIYMELARLTLTNRLRDLFTPTFPVRAPKQDCLRCLSCSKFWVAWDGDGNYQYDNICMDCETCHECGCECCEGDL